MIRHENYSQTADVFSFAVVLWQLLTREEPFQDRGQVEAAAAVAMEQARPPFPEGTPPAMVRLIETCWSQEPDQRMPFDDIVEVLQGMEKVLSDEENDWITMPLGHTVYRRKVIATNLEIPPQAAAGNNIQHPDSEKKKSKGLRTLFNRKSTHF